jgi:hypothetical protein
VSIDLDALVQTMRITAGHMAPVVLMPHEARALVAEVERLRGEAERERAAVVAWLREVADAPVAWVDDAIRDAALGIENGEHRREEEK